MPLNLAWWDPYSNQPYRLTDKALKKARLIKLWPDHLKTIFTNLLVWPMVLARYPFLQPKPIRTEEFFGLGVNISEHPDRVAAMVTELVTDMVTDMVDELGVDHLLIRFPLWHLDQRESYLALLKYFPSKHIILNLLQSRDLIVEKEAKLEEVFKAVFETFSPWVAAFQVGNAVNRAKWGFFSIDEYLSFFHVAQRVKSQYFPHLRLIGPSVIDFEYHQTIRALFNLRPLSFDQVSALLYVDRRGAPEERQMGCDLLKKIRLLASMVSLSPKAGQELLITETNWPIVDTYPYTPTSPKECVDEETYANYLVRYYLLALASRQIKTVYWHQLVAPGYGLVDNRQGFRKRGAYKAFRTMVRLLKGATLVGFKRKDRHYIISFLGQGKNIEAHWSLRPKRLQASYTQALDIYGQPISQKPLEVDKQVIYLLCDSACQVK